jgi:predicted RNA-binding protein with PUA domain
MAQLDVEKQRIQTQAKLDGAKALMAQSAQKKTLLVNSGVNLLKNYTARKHEEKRHHKELFAKGLDNAHKHASARNNPEPKIKPEGEGN